MSFDNAIDELKGKQLCYCCVGEEFLKGNVRNTGKKRKCSYCNKVRKACDIGDMSEWIEEAFNQHYIRTFDQPTPFQYSMMSDRESRYVWDRDGEEVIQAIMDAAEIPEDVAVDIQQILDDKFADFESAKMGEETEFALGTFYERKGTDDASWQMEWRQIEQSLKSQARFFNQSAAGLLSTIFDGLDTMRTRDMRPMIADAGPNTSMSSLYRARVFQSDETLKVALTRPDQHIGTPPSKDASAGRMNAKGISVFYGANDPKVALAEIRPPVGSWVVVARFDIIRPIRLLDLTALEDVTIHGSIFDQAVSRRLEQAMFLGSLSRRITKPVLPDDEAFEYLATQAIADFLANDHALNLDGIIFPSVQAAGKALNVVLFHKAAQIENIDLPPDSEVTASLGSMCEDGWEDDFSVSERVPPSSSGSKKKVPHHFDALAFTSLDDWDDDDGCFREKTLKIDLASLKVNIVKAVEFTTEEHSVTRFRFEKHEPKF